MIKPLFDADDAEWVTMVGRYMLNMGAVEFATRLLIARIHGTDQVLIFSDDLAPRVAFLKSRFPREDLTRHSWAMNVLEVATKHTTFRNTVAHCSIVLGEDAQGTRRVVGLLDTRPKDKRLVAEIISIDELKGRVDESAKVARDILAMQADFGATEQPGR